MSVDLIIRGARVFDGSGARPQVEDIAISGGRISARAPSLPELDTLRTVDGSGLWALPGLVDVHTHFDLEVELAPGLPEAVRHGTTTAVVANCSLGLAYGAQRRDGAEPIVDCFARVENVPKHVLRKVADRVSWDTSAGYLEHLDTLPLGPNIVPMIPHSMLRIEIMGLEESTRRDPTPGELDRMAALLEQAMEEGYPGFSTDALPFHYLANQPRTRRKIPTQYATYGELKRLTGVLRRYGRTWQATPPKDDRLAIIRNLLLTSGRLHGRPLKTTVVAAMDVATNRGIAKLGLLLARILNSRLVDGHFRLQALAAPFRVWSEGALNPLFEEIDVLRELNEPDLEDRDARRAIIDDPAFQARFRRMWWEGKRGFSLARLKRRLKREDYAFDRDLAEMRVDRCPVTGWTGLTLAEVFERFQTDRAGAPSEDPDERAAFEALAACPALRDPNDEADFLLALLYQFDTDLVWSTVSANRDPAMVARLILDPKLLPGFNDSGAHLTNMAFYDGNLRALKIADAHGEAAVAFTVRRLTREPAELFGVPAGRIDVGDLADLLLLDPEVLRRYEPEAAIRRIHRPEFEHEQLVNRSDGILPLVLVGGMVAWEADRHGAELGQTRMGRTLRATG